MLNGQFSSKLWLSGTADEEGLRANVGVITYFGPGAKGVLGAALRMQYADICWTYG